MSTDAFGGSFSINVYGAGRKGWFVASRRDVACVQDVGPRPLRKGQWRSFLNFVKQCRFWDLPAELPGPTNGIVQDGDWLTLSGRERDRYHAIHRFVWREAGLDQVLLYCQRVSTLFPPASVDVPVGAEPTATVREVEEPK